MNSLRLALLGLACAGCVTAETAIFWVSGPVRPGETVLVTGQFRMSAETSIKVASLTRSSGDWHSVITERGVTVALLKRTEHALMFVLPDLDGDGVYGFRIDQQNENPLFARVNLPEIWWTLSEHQGTPTPFSGGVGTNVAYPNALLRLFGRCLTHSGRPDKLQLISAAGQTRTLEPAADSPYAISVKLPMDVAPGRYSIQPGIGVGFSIDVRTETSTAFKQISLDKFGAVGDGKFDNSSAFASALSRAAALGPTIILIPPGAYLLSKPLILPPSVYLLGESQESTALCFSDIDPAPAVWIKGTHHFGLANLSIYCGNHNVILSSDESGDPALSGHVSLRGVRIRGDMFSGHIKPELALARSAKMLPSSKGYETVRLSGPDLDLEDCEVLGSGRSLNIHNTSGAIVRHNELSNGRGGWYNVSDSEAVLVVDNRISGADLSSSGGSYSVFNQPKRSQNIYTAHNSYLQMRGWDAEAFTSDGGGGAYYGFVSGTQGDALTLSQDPKWGSDDWRGALVAILSGRGLGQWRTVRKYAGRNVALSEPFAIAPDSTSTLTIAPLQLHYVFYKNHVSDAGVAIQLYGSGVEHIVAENESRYAGGMAVSALEYTAGVQPQLNIQLLQNVISGINYRYGTDNTSFAGPSLLEARANSPSAIIGLVIRGNDLKNGSVLRIGSWARAGMKGILLEGNRLSNVQADLQIDKAVSSEVVVH